MSLQQQLQKPYARDTWQQILHGLFPDGSLKLFSTPQPLKASQDFVKSTRQLGTIDLPDGNTIALLEVETTSQVKLARNRVGLRNFVSTFIDEAGASAVLAVFHQEKSNDWRLTYAARHTIIDEDSFEITSLETAPRRFTFLLGQGEPCRTAATRLAEIIGKGSNLTLLDVEKAFSVEALSKEFFAKYNEHYDKFLAELTRPERISDTRARFSILPEETEEAKAKADKPIRDFAKKLLGRLIFLHFLQKKGWMHVTAREVDWSSGDQDFLNTYYLLAETHHQAASFHSLYLAPLFFEALNTERKDHLFTLSLPGGKTFSSRMPYLNGGLFDPEPEPLRTLDLPPQLFADLFAFFAEYNFTIDENDPEDHEVGIDPEMLGHIFENLLEDNKDKGAYYTPKVIVSYMCRQSLLRYLERHLGKNEHLARLCEWHEPGDLRQKNNWCAAHAKKIATLLENVKICDPAIGSGAFPIGMLNEIVHLRTLLNHELNDPAERAKLKKSVIQNSIYGVDLDSGAVDIARLRFWLALVVDEEEPSPLPNLDYKIMQGNSLLESFQGIDLSKIHTEPDPHAFQLKTILGSSQHEFDLLDEKQAEFREVQKAKQDDLLESTRAYFAARKPERKAALRSAIDQKVIAHIAHCIAGDLEKTTALIDQQTKIASGKLPKPKGWSEKKSEKSLHALQAALDRLEKSRLQLQQTTTQPERPFFLWHLLFQDVFENGGFDIVIANPPYVRQELIKEQKPLLEAEGYQTYTGTADLFVYFYERAIQLLKPNGVLTFITSNKFYRAEYGEKVRGYLAENLTIHTLIDFGEAPIFNGVAVDATVLIGQKETAPTAHQTAALCWDFSKPATALPLEIAKAFPVSQSSLCPDGWRLVTPVVQNLLAKLRQTGTPLGEYVQGRFYYGIKTGFNEAFVIDGKKRAELIAADPKSEEIIKPFLRGRDVKRWQATHADLWLLFIPWHFPLHHDPSISGPSQEAERAFQKQYPAIYSHLLSFKDGLSARNPAETGIRYEWYALQRCAASYWQEFEQPKIGYADIGTTLKAFYSDTEMMLVNTLYFIPRATRDLHGVLLSNTSTYFWKNQFQSLGDPFDGGRTRFFSESMQHLPIPPATAEEKSRLATLAEQCAAATAAGDQATLAAREHQINQLVYRLFHLTPAEIALIEHSLAP